MPTGVERELGQGVGAGIAVQHTSDSGRARLTYHRTCIVLRLPGVHDHGTPGLGRERDLGGKHIQLGLTGRVVVMVVETAFADGDSASLERLTQLRDIPSRIELRGVVGMNAGGREHKARVLGCARRGDRRGIDGFSDADDRQCARLAGARDYLAAVAGERRVREVGVAVDEDTRAPVWRGHLRSIQRRTGAAT